MINGTGLLWGIVLSLGWLSSPLEYYLFVKWWMPWVPALLGLLFIVFDQLFRYGEYANPDMNNEYVLAEEWRSAKNFVPRIRDMLVLGLAFLFTLQLVQRHLLLFLVCSFPMFVYYVGKAIPDPHGPDS